MFEQSDSVEAGSLIQAAKTGDVDGAMEALRAGVNTETVDHENHNFTALHWCAQKGHKNIVIKLLNAGANFEARDIDGWSPLQIACFNGDEVIAMLLIGRGAEIDSKDNDGVTALMHASKEGHYNLVVFLLDDAGADANIQDVDGCTAMGHASLSGHTSVVNILAQRGANIHAKDNDGVTALMNASQEGHYNLVVFLLDDASADVDIQDVDGCTAMGLASLSGHTSVVNILAQRGANIHAKNNNGCQAIHASATYGHAQTVSALIQLGADVNCKSNEGSTPLHCATSNGHVDVVETLLRNRANSILAFENLQATHIAAMNGHLNVLMKLEEYGSDLNALCEDNDHTPLHLAVQNDYTDVAKWLIMNGANPYTFNKERNTAIHIALSMENHELVSFMASNNSFLQPSNSADAASHTCAVCLENRTTTVLTLPCRHAKICQNCVDHMVEMNNKQCPICRAEINTFIPIYL